MARFCLGFSLTEALCLGAGLAVSGFCYYMYRKKKKTADELDNASHINIDGNLKDTLEVTPGARLQYAVVEGVVEPVGEPLRSQCHEDFVGVLNKVEVTEHRLGLNSLYSALFKRRDKPVLHKQVRSVPFVLRGSDETAVRVHCPLKASGLNMEILYKRFHQVSHGFSVLGWYFSGVKSNRQLETEEMLRVGTRVTGVGELTLDPDGTLNLRPPSDGSKYFLSMAGYDTLRKKHRAAAKVWKYLAVIFALASAPAFYTCYQAQPEHLMLFILFFS
ncbi:mitochondrial ubiquitin ligase activator of nfkb 1-A-like [Parambassis ranga]|uniref:RING-type E3 ubiquitin transferase n=1 Tax=Parambassis ranga TaxID=210632 RepID=A0A6P7K762_9TELE|nr:mitochondrial ubiquitin ligase activator of nfkb 1-A-like [Parambassis ranga]